MRKYPVYIFLYLMGILLSLSSCIMEYYDDIPQENNTVQLELFIRAYEYNTPVARTGNANEDDIDLEPYILVFKQEGADYKFVEAVKSVRTNSDTKTYVLLKAQSAECKLLILTNCQEYFYTNRGGGTYTAHIFNETNLNTELSGLTLDDATAILYSMPLANPQTEVPYTTLPKPKIPMAIVYTTSAIDGNTTIGTTTDGDPTNDNILKLKRIVSKIVVENTAPGFTLKGITAVLNAPIRGRLYNEGNPSASNTVDLVEYRRDDNYLNEIAEAFSNSTETNPVYLYESASANKTTLIIKGEFQGNITYYKLAIVDNSGNYLDILRNHYYKFTLNKVSGTGHKNIEDAIVAPEFNNTVGFEAGLTVTHLEGFETTAFGNYYVSVSNSRYWTYTNSTTETLDAFQLYAYYATSVNPCRVEPLSTGLSYPAGSFPPSGTLTTIQIERSGSIVQGEIEIALGNLKKIITVEKKGGAISAAGETLKFYRRESGEASDSFDYYLLSGEVTSGSAWIKLTPGTDIIRDDAENIVVDDGKIHIKILANTEGARKGTVYLTTIKNPTEMGNPGEVYRIKVNIDQLGKVLKK